MAKLESVYSFLPTVAVDLLKCFKVQFLVTQDMVVVQLLPGLPLIKLGFKQVYLVRQCF